MTCKTMVVDGEHYEVFAKRGGVIVRVAGTDQLGLPLGYPKEVKEELERHAHFLFASNDEHIDFDALVEPI